MSPTSRPAVLTAFFLFLSASLPTLADAQRLEADLRALFADTPGELTIGQVSDGLFGGSTAEDLVFIGADGDRARLARYTVKGDYDQPDAVVMEGLRLEAQGDEPGIITAERMVVGEPSQPLLALHDLPLDGELEAAELTIDGLAISREVARTRGEGGKEVFLGTATGRLAIEHLYATELSRQAIGSLEMTGISGSGEQLADIGDGHFSLASVSLAGLRGLDREDERTLDRLELTDLSIEAERLVATLDRLRLDGDMADGEGGLWLESLDLDLARMIAMAPAEERTRLRMASNVLTGGSGQLRLDAVSSGRWEAGDAAHRLLGEMHLTAAEAFGWDLEADLPVRLPEGVEPAAFLADPENLEEVTLLGGRIDALLTDRGLFDRLAPIIAAGQGISEADFLAQARTQAKGFGMLFGPQIETLLTGLVNMMAGDASELAIHLTLPVESGVEGLAADPLALPDRLSMRVEVR